MKDQQLKLRYRKRPFVTLLMLVLTIFFVVPLFFIDFEKSGGFHIILILLVCFFLFSIISQLTLWKKDYHFLIDKKNKKIYIDNGLRKNKVVKLDDILGVAYSSVTGKSTTTYTLQFKVLPRVWGEYYNKNSPDIKHSEEFYKYMFICIGIINQNEEDVMQIISYLKECGLKPMEFEKTTLGKTYGILKKQSIDTQSKEYKKLVYKQWVSYFLKWLLPLSFILHFMFQFLGRINGIYW